MAWTNQEKAYCVEAYFKTGSLKATATAFRKTFQRRNSPAKSQIWRWVAKFRSSASIQNEKHLHRLPIVRTQENIAKVQESVERSPKKSIRRRSQQMGFSRESLRRMLNKDLGLYPYRIQVKQQLTACHIRQRKDMCSWFLQRMDEEATFLENIWFSDEAHFYLSGYVNTKNYVYWGTSRPDCVMQRPLHSKRCTAWAALSVHGIIGPYWFEDEDGQTTTVNTERYINVLERF